MLTSKSNQQGFFHLQTLLVFVLVIGIVSFAGYKVLNTSRAGTNPYANGIISSGYQNFSTITSQPTYLPSQSYTVVQQAFPNECAGNMDQIAPKQTWNANKFTYTCLSGDQSKLSLVTMGYDLSSPQMIKSDKYSTGSSVDIAFFQVDSMAFKKDGSMSKIAQIDMRGNGTTTDHKIGIYDVATKVISYLKDSAGKDIVSTDGLRTIEWSPDNSKLYFLKDEYRDGGWQFKVCNISVTGGDMNCITPKGTSDTYIQSYSNDPIWSYDLGSLYFRSGHLDSNNNFISSIFKYSTTYNNFTKVIDAGNNGNYFQSDLSPDSRYLIVGNFESGSYVTKVFDTVSSNFVSGTTISTTNVMWQAVKAGTPAITLPPDSGPQLVGNYQVTCTATFGKLARGVQPVSVRYTNNGPDSTPATNTGSLILKSPTETLAVGNVAVPSLPAYGSFTWNTQASSFGRRSTYTISADYKNQAGAQLALCSGTKTLTTK